MFHRVPLPTAWIVPIAAFLACASAQAAAYVKTTSSGQAIYAKASESAKVGTLPAGTVMAVREGSVGQNAWIQVAAPDCIDCWVWEDALDNDSIRLTKVKVRTAPNTVAPEVALLTSGETVLVRGKQKDWVKIAPPASATFWVKADSVVSTGAPSPVTASAAPTPAQPPAPVLPTHVATPPTREPAPVPVPEPAAPVAQAPTPVAPVWQPPVIPTTRSPSPVADASPAEPPALPPVVAQPAPVIDPAPPKVETAAIAAAPVVTEPPHTTPSSPVQPTPVAPAPARTDATAVPRSPAPAKTSTPPSKLPPVATTPRPVTPATTRMPAWRASVPATRPAAVASTPAPVVVPTPIATTSDWEQPSPHGHAPAPASVSAALAGVGPYQTSLPQIRGESDWDDPNPGTLMPSRRRAPVVSRIPDEIADEKLSQTFVQGKPGRAVGTLVHDEGGFLSSSRYEIRTFSDDGESSEFVAVVLGRPETLNPLVGRLVRADGTVWWLHGKSSTPFLAVESVTPLR